MNFVSKIATDLNQTSCSRATSKSLWRMTSRKARNLSNLSLAKGQLRPHVLKSKTFRVLPSGKEHNGILINQKTNELVFLNGPFPASFSLFSSFQKS